MTLKSESRFQLGDKVIRVWPGGRWNVGRTEQVTITKVGRKWFYVENEDGGWRTFKYSLEDGHAYYDPSRENGSYHPVIYTPLDLYLKREREWAVEQFQNLRISGGLNRFTTHAILVATQVLEEGAVR